MSGLREQINTLLFQYVDALNCRDEDRFANNFCKDGIWEVPGLFTRVGRVAIRESRDLPRHNKWIFQIVHQFHILRSTNAEAWVRTYVTEHGHRDGTGVFFLAIYNDHCVIEDESWRFKHRLCDILYRGNANLSDEILRYPAPAHN
jgi:hypothetical protein